MPQDWKKTTVEIIPWVHNVSRRDHKAVVDYIKSLQKNSWLAIELSPAYQTYFSKLHDLLVGKKPSNTFGSRLEQEYSRRAMQMSPEMLKRSQTPSHLAALEVLNECKKRNIKVIPMETLVADEVARFREKFLFFPLSHAEALEQYRTELENQEFREATMARQIQTILYTFSGRRLFVLTGMDHALPLEKTLKEKGINVQTSLEMFPKKQEIAGQLATLAKIREAIKEKKTTVWQIYSLIKKSDMARAKRKPLSKEERRREIMNALVERDAKANSRMQRKLGMRKARAR